ncbi:MAG: nucleotidyl transferase AbiEii/AbiGii toxin family protein [Caldilinea sp.]
MDVNTALQDRFLALFFTNAVADSFYLTGGTALARFYFHHRESIDLDLFTNQRDADFDAVNRAVLGILQTLTLRIQSQVTTPTFLQYIVVNDSGVTLKVDLVKDVPVHFGATRKIDGLRLDSLENIGANKVLAVFGRTDAKDFIDLYWILQRTNLMFDDLYALAKEKDLGLSELYLAYALHSAAKIKLFPRMLEPLPWEQILIYFEELARDLLLRSAPD